MSKKKTINKDNIKDVGLPIEPDVQDQEINANEIKEDIQEQEIIEVKEEIKDNSNNKKVQEDKKKPIVIEQVDEKIDNTKSHKGIVINTSKLNVRKLPSLESEIIDVIKNKDTLMINPSKSTSSFYHVTLDNGLEGYCVRDYIVG